MGSKLAVLAALTAVAAARPAAADSSADLMKAGIALYKAGKYADAAAKLKQAYAIDHKPETLFALAQAERLSGDCAAAAPHYHQVIEQVSDFNVAKLVQQNLSLCEKDLPEPPAPAVAAPPAPPPPPKIITKTVVREVRHTDPLAVTLIGAGALALGAGGGLLVAGNGDLDAAQRARTLDDHDTLASRGSRDQVLAAIAAGAGVALVGVGVFRWAHAGAAPRTEVAVVPALGGGTLWVTSRW